MTLIKSENTKIDLGSASFGGPEAASLMESIGAISPDRFIAAIEKYSNFGIIQSIKAATSTVLNKIEIEKYFKNDSNKSVRICMHRSLVELIKQSADSKIKSRLSEINEKLSLKSDMVALVKNQYVIKNNFNFFNLNIGDDATTITYSTRKFIEERIWLIVLYDFMNTVIYWPDEAPDGKRIEFSNIRALIRIYFTKKVSQHHNNPLYRDIEILSTTHRPYKRFGYGCLVPGARPYMPSVINGLSLMTTLSRTSGMSISCPKMFSSILNAYEHDLAKLNSISKVEKKLHINQVSGFESIKNVRVPLNDFIPEEDVEAASASFSKINEFIESFANNVKKYELSLNANKCSEVKEVKGYDIVKLYHISSYKESTFEMPLKQTEGINGSTGKVYNGWKVDENAKAGTLFTSCMRNSGSIARIAFYAKNSDFISMLAVTNKAGNKISGRAIVWEDQSTGFKYVDRIFYKEESDLNKIVAHVENTPNMFNIHLNQGSRFSSRKNGGEVCFKLDKLIYDTHMPYLDSVCFYFDKKEQVPVLMSRNCRESSTGRKLEYLSVGIYDSETDSSKDSLNTKGETARCSICRMNMGGKKSIRISVHGDTNQVCEKCLKLDSTGELYVSKRYLKWFLSKSDSTSNFVNRVYHWNDESKLLVEDRYFRKFDELKKVEKGGDYLATYFAFINKFTSRGYDYVLNLKYDKSRNKFMPVEDVRNNLMGKDTDIYYDSTNLNLIEVSGEPVLVDKNMSKESEKYLDAIKKIVEIRRYHRKIPFEKWTTNTTNKLKLNTCFAKWCDARFLNGSYSPDKIGSLTKETIDNVLSYFIRCSITDYENIEAFNVKLEELNELLRTLNRLLSQKTISNYISSSNADARILKYLSLNQSGWKKAC